MASTSEAIGNNLESDEFRSLPQINTAIIWQMRGFADVINHLRSVWAGTVMLRRTGMMSLSSWEESARKRLLRQPLDGGYLFNGVIPEEQKRLGELAQSEVALRALKYTDQTSTVLRSGSYTPRRFRRSYGTSSRGGTSSAQPKSRYTPKGGVSKSSSKRGGRFK